MSSSSTMHLITKRELTLDDFSFEDEDPKDLDGIISLLNSYILDYQTHANGPNSEHKKSTMKRIFRKIKQLLPEGFNQRRIIRCSYETLINMHRQRCKHRLQEWKDFCTFVENLPYIQEFINGNEGTT